MMSLVFDRILAPPLRNFSAKAPGGAIIGIIGEAGAGQAELFELAAGQRAPVSGSLAVPGPARVVGPLDPLPDHDPENRLLLVYRTLDLLDPFARTRAGRQLEAARRGGATVLLVSNHEATLIGLADEIWWLCEGELAGRGAPLETWRRFETYLSHRLRAWGETRPPLTDPTFRRGDGRAEVVGIETLGAEGEPTSVWRSGESVAVRFEVRFRERVESPVFGIMIRTRIGFEVYGTNTQLEGLKTGPVEPSQRLRVEFRFRCDLCPQEYTLTVASHDENGVWHDWLEDAIAFSVTDSRYTAGVAKLQARVEVAMLDAAD